MRALLLFFPLLPVVAAAQGDSLPPPDSLFTAGLESIVVRASRGFDDYLPEARVAAGVGQLDAAAVGQAADLTPLAAFNQLPGVRFEQRAPGSYRLSIRGSTLRSPFGVRNVKVYWNGLPFTQPGGDTPLNFLDNAQYGRVEVIRGPASSVFGAGTAGAVLISSATPAAPRLRLAQTGGSFGTSRSEVALNLGKPAGRTELRLADQRSDGYRDHARFARQTAELAHYRGGLALHALFTRLHYDLPGALTAEQYAENPRQARPGSAATNASINYHNLLLGATYDHHWANWTLRTATYATGFYFDHPFNFDYKRETNLGAGGRASLHRRYELPRGDLTLTLGSEQQLQLRMANNFANADQQPGALNFSDEVTTTEGLYFARAALELTGGWRATAGASLNHLRYAVDRTFAADGPTGRTRSAIPTILRPRLSLLKQLGEYAVYAAVSTGFSPPTLSEFRTNEGSLNVGLAPERGTNYETGLKYRPAHGRSSLTVALYALRLRQSITSFSDGRGTRLFRNAGETEQRGLELSFRRSLLRDARGRPRLDLNASYALSHYRYGDFTSGGTDVSGQPLPGTAPHVANLWLNYDDPTRWFATLSWNYTDRIPLNDAGTVFADAYHLLRAKLGAHLAPAGRLPLDLFVGADNLLDQRLTLGSDLNPRFGNRYFQPGDGRFWYVGVRVSGRGRDAPPR